jgi:ABC-2 type transport system ATP-binding protein
MTDYAIETEHLSRSFQTLIAVNDLSLSVPAGTLFGFLGANGAGKTTTIHLLLGLLAPTSGNARVLGFDIKNNADAIRARTGTLLEFNGLYERMNAEDNLDFYARIYRMPHQERQARIKELLTHMNLWDRRHDLVGSWSRGMKQKLAVARTLLHHPALVFLDEPTAGLDPLASMQLNDDLVNLTQQEGTTVFLNTHNLADAQKYCDQVGVIREGKLMAQGNPDELRLQVSGPQVDIFGTGFSSQLLTLLYARPGVLDIVYHHNHLKIKLEHSDDVNDLVALITQNGGVIEEVRRGYGSLEEAFASLMEAK